ncbi:MAG: endonuclease III [Verrucomicrobia bacterium GWC2_42_7]|nr:MAG: endonuclease III [Verrucomicrobia bacterium GWC2_42_7]
MKKTEYILKKLKELYPEMKIPLDHKNPFTLLVAVVLSARCTDVQVNKITPKLFALADTPQKMASLSVQQIQDIIRPCGLSPRKSVAIKQLSTILLEQFDSEVPANWDALESLPGVGHKTASVVMAQAFHIPAFPIDTHIQRLALRWGLTTSKNVKKIEADLKKSFPEHEWIPLHLKIIQYGRDYCTARGCKGTCPICSAIKNDPKL